MSLPKYLAQNKRKIHSCLFLASINQPHTLNAGRALREYMGAEAFRSTDVLPKLGGLMLHTSEDPSLRIKTAIGLYVIYKETRFDSSLDKEALKTAIKKVAAPLAHRRVTIVCTLRNLKAVKAIVDVTLQATAVDIVALGFNT